MEPFWHKDADIKAIIHNERPSKSSIYSGYMPAFKVKDDYLTSGRIKLVDCDELKYGEDAFAEIRFITPEAYPHCLHNGQIIRFQEGCVIHGFIKVIEINNKLLER